MRRQSIKILLTGSDGFIGSNFKRQVKNFKIITVGSQFKLGSDFNVDLKNALM